MQATITENVSFDEEKHEYTYLGKRIPSCTQVINAFADSYANVPPFVLQRKARIGTAVHAGTELLDIGEEPEEDQDTKPYLYAYRLFKEVHEPEAVLLEKRMIAFGETGIPYGMTLDRVSIIDGKVWLLDIKTSAKPHMDSWGIQSAAYSNGLDNWSETVCAGRKAGIVHLLKNGTFKLIPIEWEKYSKPFQAALLTYDYFKIGERSGKKG